MHTQIIRPPAFQKPSGKLVLSSNQNNLVDGVLTLAELDTIPSGYTDGIEDVANYKITPGMAGYYLIAASVYLSSVVADKMYVAYIYKSGSGIAGNILHSKLAEPLIFPMLVPCQYLSATDYLQLWVKSESGDNTVDISAIQEYTYLSVQRIR